MICHCILHEITCTIHTTIVFQNLMQELEVERERRWKAEQAAKKLIDHIKELKSKGKHILLIGLDFLY